MQTVTTIMKLEPGAHYGNKNQALRIGGLLLSEFRSPGARAHRPSGTADIQLEQSPPAWLARGEDIFRSRYTHQLSLNALVDEVGVHPIHLTRTFRRYCGCSIGEHLRELRVQHACRLLATSDSPLTEIAAIAGFCDQSHLCRAIRSRRGLTPGALHRRVKSWMNKSVATGALRMWCWRAVAPHLQILASNQATFSVRGSP